jgi:RNA polymerase sigma-70 factor, ECF subfamily
MKAGGAGNGNEVFRALYRRYYGRMMRFFRTVFRVSEEDAEELTQDTFLRFYKAISGYRGDAEWAFLEQIARRVGLNRVRAVSALKRGAGRTDSLDDADSSFVEPRSAGADPAETAIANELRARLREAIRELPNGQRQCLLLRLEGLSYQEIRAVLEISMDAVRSRLRDAKRLLRQRLGVECELPEDES